MLRLWRVWLTISVVEDTVDEEAWVECTIYHRSVRCWVGSGSGASMCDLTMLWHDILTGVLV